MNDEIYEGEFGVTVVSPSPRQAAFNHADHVRRTTRQDCSVQQNKDGSFTVVVPGGHLSNVTFAKPKEAAKP